MTAAHNDSHNGAGGHRHVLHHGPLAAVDRQLSQEGVVGHLVHERRQCGELLLGLGIVGAIEAARGGKLCQGVLRLQGVARPPASLRASARANRLFRLANRHLLAIITSFRKYDPTKGEQSCRRSAFAALGSSHFPGPSVRGCTPLGQSDRVFKALDEVLGRAFPESDLSSPPGSGPICLAKGAGRESNLLKPCTSPRQSSVFPDVSKGPTRGWSETLRCSAIELQCLPLSYVRVGAGGTRTHNPRLLKHVLQPAVGLYQMGDEVVARGCTELPGQRRKALDGA